MKLLRKSISSWIRIFRAAKIIAMSGGAARKKKKWTVSCAAKPLARDLSPDTEDGIGDRTKFWKCLLSLCRHPHKTPINAVSPISKAIQRRRVFSIRTGTFKEWFHEKWMSVRRYA